MASPAIFTVHATESHQSRNVGAIWERLDCASSRQNQTLSDEFGEETLSISATADAAEQLFHLHERLDDRICLNAALRASQWLLLHQRSDGSYLGDKVQASTGVVLPDEQAGKQAAIYAACAFVRAYRASRAEVYITAASRALNSALSQVCPECITNEPIGRLTQAAAMMYSESASQRNRKYLEQAADLQWLQLCQHSDSRQRAAFSGSSETNTALAAVDMFIALGETRWLDQALQSLSGAVASGACAHAFSIEAYFSTLLALPALIVGCQPDLRDGHVRVGWSSYSADPAAGELIAVNSDRSESSDSVDYLPLVSKIGRSVLIPVLAEKTVGRISISSGRRLPYLTDLVTGEIVCQPALLHDLPFESNYKWGCFLIEN